VQLADGYLDEEQTARAFRHLDDGVRIYRTGDRARVVDGVVELLGRLDDQVKIRGVRVEPREAELAIADHPAVRGVAVVAADTGAGRELVAFVVATPPADQTVWRDPELTASVLAHARMSLTGAHVPTTVYGIDRLPLSRNGKLDRRRLADLAAELAGREDAADPDDIAAVWRAATGSDTTDTGFLDLGGTSIGAARVAAAVLRATGSRMPLRWLLTDNLGLGDLLRRTSAPATTAAVTTDGALSAGQRMLWFLRELHGSLSAYNVVSAVRVAGPVPTLAERLAEIVAGQDELRTRFVTDEDGQPRREVLPTVELPLTTVAGETDQLLTSLQEHDFKPDEAPLFRVVVLPHGTTTTVVFAASHLIADQYSAEIIWSHLLDGVPVTGAVAAPRPPDAAEVASALAYWRGALDGAPPHLNLPFRRALDTVPSFAGHSAVRALPAEYRRDSAALLAAFAAVLSSWTGDPDVVVGMAYDGRRGRDDANWIGFGVDSLPIRVTVDPAAAMDDLTLAVRQRIRDAAKHSAARVDDIVAALAVPRTMDRSPLFQAWFNDLSTIEQPLAADRPRVPQPPALFDVGLYVYGRADGGLDLQITCAADLFDAAVAEHLADGLLATVTAPPGTVSAMLPRGEAPAAVAAGPTADLATLLDRFHTVGDNDAVAIGDVTYGDLRAQVASAAAVIAGHDNLAVLATPSPWLVVALLACWSAGVSPLVVDGDLPAGYLDGILRDAGVTTTIGEDLSVLGQQPTPARPPADVAHRLTTSGSTGAPAVITVPATAFATALLRHAEEFDLGPDDRFAVLSGAGHDPVFREAVLPLLIGARTFFPAEHERADVTALARALDRERVTVLYLTPPRGELLAAAAEADHTTLHHVRLVVFGGSVLEWRTVDRIRALCPNARVANGYGLTEVSQLASAYHCGTASDGTVPIGYGASGRRLVLLRDGHAAAVGQLGRIAVAEPYPVGLRDGVALGGPLVLTGDTGRIGLDGELRWCGRADRQISVDGHRVEPHEVERRLLAEPEVRTATVGVHGAMLVAQIVPTTAVPGLGEQLKDRLRAVLPAWLVPDRIDVVDRLAVNRNGKPALDPAAAPAPPPTADRSLADIVRAHLPDGAVLTGQTTFFEAGLDSHALVRVVRDLQRSGYPTVRLVDLFRWPNVTALTAGLAARQQPAPPVERASGLRSHADRRRHLRAALRAPTQGGPQRG
jgi:acyl-coenzyme A synthetase/AMP-(fatty) acid ligase